MKKIAKLFSIVAARNPLWFKALCNGVGAGGEHVDVLRNLNCRAVVDIGANRGQFALAARHCFPEAKIISFEPLGGPAKLFERVLGKDPDVRLHRIAIGPEKSDAIIHISGRDDSSSLLPISNIQERLFPGTGEVRTEKIKVGRLADFISANDITAPALLKLDVQGYELDVLTGCQDLLDRFAYVYVECSFVELYEGQALADEVIAWLRERGFRFQGVYNVSYDPKGLAVQGDFLLSATLK